MILYLLISKLCVKKSPWQAPAILVSICSPKTNYFQVRVLRHKAHEQSCITVYFSYIWSGKSNHEVSAMRWTVQFSKEKLGKECMYISYSIWNKQGRI